MKINKVFGKSQIAVTAMVLALALAIWLNMKYSDTGTKYLGEATYVNNSSSGQKATQTSAKAKEEDYFETVRKQREETKEKIEETVKETLKSEKLSDEDKRVAVSTVTELVKNTEKESNIEALIIAKGFDECVAVINDDNITIVVKSEGLTTAQTLQLQDIATSQTEIPLSNVKIVTVK